MVRTEARKNLPEKNTCGEKNKQEIWVGIMAQAQSSTSPSYEASQYKTKQNETLMNWCRPRMPHHVTNYDFIGSMIPDMHCKGRTQPVMVPCRRNINFCLTLLGITQTPEIIFPLLNLDDAHAHEPPKNKATSILRKRTTPL